MTREDEFIKRDALESAAHWFIVMAGLVYGTGFLIVVTFLDRFGLRDEGTEFFRTKYIYVGVLFLLLPAIVGVPLLSLMSLRDHLKKQEEQFADLQIYVPSVILTINMLLVFYVFVAFAPPGLVVGRYHVVPIIFAATLLGLAAIRWSGQFIKSEVLAQYSNWARWLLCILIVVGLDFYSFEDLFRILWEMLARGGYIFIVFVSLMWWVVWRTTKRLGDLKERGLKVRRALLPASLCIVAALYYLSALAFAARIYPYIPVVRGGGDYTSVPRATLRFQESSAGSIPSDILPTDTGSGLASRPLLILEMTSASVFVVDPTEGGGPAEWRKPGRLNLKVVQIRREIVESILYSN